MARQVGEIKITGTVDGITFYKMDGAYYAREKSSLSRKRVLRDPAFKRSMESAHRLARGSQLASRVYRALEKDRQQYGLYCALKRMAVLALKEGKSEQEVVDILQRSLVKTGEVGKPCAETSTLEKRQRLKVPRALKGLFVIPKEPAPSKRQTLALKGRTYSPILPAHELYPENTKT